MKKHTSSKPIKATLIEAAEQLRQLNLNAAGIDYVEIGAKAYEERHRNRVIFNLKRRAKEMGFELTAPGAKIERA